MNETLKKILNELRGVMRSGAGWVAMCPAHDDKRQSLSIAIGEDGKVLMKCHAGCTIYEICAAMKVEVKSLFPDSEEQPVVYVGSSQLNIVATYPYRDPETGDLLSEVVRLEPKSFRQRRPDGKGGWIYQLGDVKRVLYRLWDLGQLKKKSERKAVCFVEGEKDADALWAIGLPATTSLGGASAWRSEYALQAKGAGIERVAIFPDNDAPGRKHAQVVAASLHSVGIVVLVVELPGLPEKGDVSDFLSKAEHPKGDLVRAIQEHGKAWEPGTGLVNEPTVETVVDDEIGLRYVKLSDVEPKLVEWLWPGRIPLGMLTLLAGDAGGGKSFLSEYIAACLSKGTDWPDGKPLGEVSATIFLAAEDSLAEVTRPRADAMGADVDKIYVITAAITKDGKDRMVSLSEDLGRIRALAKKTGAKLIVIDPINAYLGGKVDNYKDPEVRAVLTPIAQMADELRIAVLGIMHLSKAAQAQVIYRIGGSVAFAALARAVFFVSRDKDDNTLRLFTNPKMSVAKEADTRGFRIVPVEGADSARLEWVPEAIEISAADAMKDETPQAKHGKKAEMKSWLADFLKDGPHTQQEVEAACLEMGGSKSTLNKAKAELKVKSSRMLSDRGVIGPWTWSLPEQTTREGF